MCLPLNFVGAEPRYDPIGHPCDFGSSPLLLSRITMSARFTPCKENLTPARSPHEARWAVTLVAEGNFPR
jgi:hypothetical protein